MPPQAFTAGQSFALAKNTFSIEGYTFSGWTDSPLEEEPLYADEMVITLYSDITLYAVWKEAETPPEEENTFTVTFIANEPYGTAAIGTMIPQAFTAEQPFALSKNTFSIEGYMFSGWTLDASSTEATYADGMEIILYNSIALYAVWEKVGTPPEEENKHTVKFIANAPQGFTAQGSMPPQSSSSESEWIKLAKNAFSVPEHIFKGWATDASSKEVIYKDEEDIYHFTEDLVLYAVWEYWLSVDEEGNLIVQPVDDMPSDVVIPEGATTIGKETYSGSTFLDIYLNFKSLKIPSSLKYIDEQFTFTTDAFAGFFDFPVIDKRTKGLPFKFIVDEKNPYFKTNDSGNMLLSKDGKKLYFVTNSSSDYAIPSTVENIKAGAFIGAEIQSLDLDGVTLEVNCTFENCAKLTSVVLKNITVIDGDDNIRDFDPSRMFLNCTALKSADLSGCNIERMLGTFSNCTSLTEVKLPETLEDMSHTFAGCTSLTQFTIPANVSKLYMNLGSGRDISVEYLKTVEDYKKIMNDDAGHSFLPTAFGGNVNVTVTCSDGKVIYTAGSDEIKVKQN